MKRNTLSELPSLFCWTRFGTEAGESIEKILLRKEIERRSNNGIFLWGIGNAIGPSIAALTQETSDPRVIFSPIKGSPRQKDVEPSAVVAWSKAYGLDGSSYTLPAHSLVTSRYDPQSPRPYHFALVCSAKSPLVHLNSDLRIGFDELRNLRTGRPVGSSQVTAVVQRCSASSPGTEYDVAIVADLAYPFFVRLTGSYEIDHNQNRFSRFSASFHV